MELNADLKSKDVMNRQKNSTLEPHLTVNQRLILDDVIDVIEDAIPIDPMEVRVIISKSLKKWESINEMRFSDLEKMPKGELKATMNRVFNYFEQIATKKLKDRVQNQLIKKSLEQVKRYYFKKYFPDLSKKKLILYLGLIAVIIAASVLTTYALTSLGIFSFNYYPYYPIFP